MVPKADGTRMGVATHRSDCTLKKNLGENVKSTSVHIDVAQSSMADQEEDKPKWQSAPAGLLERSFSIKKPNPLEVDPAGSGPQLAHCGPPAANMEQAHLKG